MTDHAPPSADPADDDNLAGVLRHAFRKLMQQTDNMLPAQVVAYNRAKNRATVVPLVAVLTTDGRQVGRAQVASVPVMQFGGGGVVLNFNLKPGDLGWIHASDRDISLFLQSYKAAQPNTARLHSFQDGVFIPEVMRGWTIAAEDATNAVLQTLDGNAAVSVGVGFVKVRFAGHSVKLDASGVNIIATNAASVTAPTVSLTASTSVTVSSPAINITNGGGKSMTVGAGGTTITGGLVLDGLTVGTHVHTDPQGGNTGGPHN